MNPLQLNDPQALAEFISQSGVQDSPAANKLMLLSQLMSGNAQPEKKSSPNRQLLKSHIRKLQHEHRMLQERSDLLAEALGACYCWGTDKACESCKGTGQPGATAPDPEAFDEFVMPVLKRLGIIREEDADSTEETARLSTAEEPHD